MCCLCVSVGCSVSVVLLGVRCVVVCGLCVVCVGVCCGVCDWGVLLCV